MNLSRCCACRYLSVQPDFQDQKCKIEKVIKNSSDSNHNQVLYYPKFHCELNHIEHYWCHCKAYARHHCEYSLEKLRRRVPEALASVGNKTVLANYYCCRQKMALYCAGILYGSSEWQSKMLHQKIYSRLEDR